MQKYGPKVAQEEYTNSVIESYNKPKKGALKEYRNAQILEQATQTLMVIYILNKKMVLISISLQENINITLFEP